MPKPGVILKLHIKPGGAAKAADGRRAAREHARLFNMAKSLRGALNDGIRAAGVRVAILPRIQAHKHARHVLAVAAGAGADGREHRGDVGFFFLKEIALHLLHHFQRLLLGGAGGQLDRGHKHAAIFLRQKRRGQA